MATNAVIQTVGAAGYVSLRVTQTGHGLTGRVPVYYNTSTNLWTAARANAGNTLGTHLAKVIDSNTLLIVQSGIFPDPTHGLTAGQYYFVSDSVAGTLTVTEPTAVGSFSNPVLYVTDANTYIVLGYRSSQTVSQSFNPLLNDGTAAAPSLAFSADPDTGVYRPGANRLGFAANGTAAGEFNGTDFKFNSGYGSVETAYGCRAWVNFNGTLSGTITPRANGNVTSVTKNGTGDYTVNFTTATPDTNYSVVGTAMRNTAAGSADPLIFYIYNSTTYGDAFTTGSVRIKTTFNNALAADPLAVCLGVFR